MHNSHSARLPGTALSAFTLGCSKKLTVRASPASLPCKRHVTQVSFPTPRRKLTVAQRWLKAFGLQTLSHLLVLPRTPKNHDGADVSALTFVKPGNQLRNQTKDLCNMDVHIGYWSMDHDQKKDEKEVSNSRVTSSAS